MNVQYADQEGGLEVGDTVKQDGETTSPEENKRAVEQVDKMKTELHMADHTLDTETVHLDTQTEGDSTGGTIKGRGMMVPNLVRPEVSAGGN